MRPVEPEAIIDQNFPKVFKSTHITNRKELRAAEEARARAEAAGLVGDAGEPIVIPQVEEEWINEPS